LLLLAQEKTSPKAIALAGLIAVAGPGIRALNPSDATFGLVADRVDAELKTLAKKSAKKVSKK
jgi:hypothetical protein